MKDIKLGTGAAYEKDKKIRKSSQTTKDESQPYASFDCPECVQMASLMLEEELRYYMQRSHGKRGKGGKSRDALFRSNLNTGGSGIKSNG